jgi:large subunit ribosomal protein L1
VKSCVEEIKKGRIEFKVDKTGIINNGIGKVSFEDSKIEDNARHFGVAVRKAKPTSLKGTYIKSLHICTTMSPSVKISINEIED